MMSHHKFDLLADAATLALKERQVAFELQLALMNQNALSNSKQTLFAAPVINHIANLNSQEDDLEKDLNYQRGFNIGTSGKKGYTKKQTVGVTDLDKFNKGFVAGRIQFEASLNQKISSTPRL